MQQRTQSNIETSKEIKLMSPIEQTNAIMKLIEIRASSARDDKSLDKIKKLIPSASLDVGAFFWDPTIDLYDTGTVLSAAITSNDPDVVELLIASGADVNFALDYCDLPLKTAVLLAHKFNDKDEVEKYSDIARIIKLLLLAGADSDLKTTNKCLSEHRLTPREADKLGLIDRALIEVQMVKETAKKLKTSSYNAMVSEIYALTNPAPIYWPQKRVSESDGSFYFSKEPTMSTLARLMMILRKTVDKTSPITNESSNVDKVSETQPDNEESIYELIYNEEEPIFTESDMEFVSDSDNVISESSEAEAQEDDYIIIKQPVKCG